MKYHVLSVYVDKILAEEFAIFKIKLSFLTDILLLALVKTISEKLFHSVHQYAPFLSNIVNLLFASFHPGSKKQENVHSIHPYAI